MINIGTTAMAPDARSIAPQPKAGGGPLEGDGDLVFAELLAGNNASPLHEGEQLGQFCNQLESNGGREESDDSPSVPASPQTQSAPAVIMSTAGQLIFAALPRADTVRGSSGRTIGEMHAAGGRAATDSTPDGAMEMPSRNDATVGQVTRLPPEKRPIAVLSANLKMHSPGASGGSPEPAGVPRALSPRSVREETHLLAVTYPNQAAGQLTPTANAIEYDAASTETALEGTRPVASRVGEGLVGDNPGDAESRLVIGQIFDQVAAALASRSGSSPAAPLDSAAQASTVSRDPAAPPDVVKALRFDLHPGGLGEVHVRLSIVRNELQLQLSFTVDKVADIARADAQALMEELADGGIAVGQLVIKTSTNPSMDVPGRRDDQASGGPNSERSTADWSDSGRGQQGQQGRERRNEVRARPADAVASAERSKSGLFI